MYRLKDLVASELDTIQKTRESLRGIAESYPKIIDLLLSIPQLIDKSDEKLDREQQTYFYYGHYIQAHATAFCIYKMYESGYYLEAMILIRHMLEAYIQMRYFRKYPGALLDHITLKHRIQFRVMFEEFSPGFYKRYYSNLLSEAAHGMGLKYIMRAVGTLGTPNGQLVIGNMYNENHATLVINTMTAVLSGYFNHIDGLLPRNMMDLNELTRKQFDELRTWLNDSIDALEKQKSETKDFVDHCRALFR